MELIRISNRKIKIMLTPTDMTHFELNADTIGEDTKKTHHAFRLLLSELKNQIGFEADDKHISVQYFPSREGGCEMFISNLDENDDMGGASNKMKAEERKALQPRTMPHRTDCFLREFAYCFTHLDDLLSACKRLSSIGYICESAAYVDTFNRYHLLLSTRCNTPFSIPDEIAFLVEHGKVENASTVKIYLREHGVVICPQNAVLHLSEFV